jgi:hypothetical protein
MSSATDGSIGIQQILPRSGTAWDNQNPAPPVQPDKSAADDSAPPPDRAAKPDSVGKVVDKLV